ncbi:MAG: threonylcarbamoyl-AMP synthase [Candidatus Hydrogenedens sp.]|nr:threonylcarbamoyl-AMP synthase [Candidatus Hydrogenedens sp.]
MLGLPPTTEGIAEAARRIRAGEVVAYPTETVYGLAADPFNPAAIEAVFRVKGRPDANPILLIVSSECQLEGIAGQLSARAREMMERFWPGPLSLLLPAEPGLHPAIAPVGGKVCVRCPGLPLARRLCDAVGHAITSTSANLSGADPAMDGEACAALNVSAVLDGGPTLSSVPSTIYDPDTGAVIRAGAIPPEALQVGSV